MGYIDIELDNGYEEPENCIYIYIYVYMYVYI